MNLKTLRASLNLTQAQMAERIGIHVTTYCDYEKNGEPGILRNIAKEFDVEISILPDRSVHYFYSNQVR